jgi:hypothetical protein
MWRCFVVWVLKPKTKILLLLFVANNDNINVMGMHAQNISKFRLKNISNFKDYPSILKEYACYE